MGRRHESLGRCHECERQHCKVVQQIQHLALHVLFGGSPLLAIHTLIGSYVARLPANSRHDNIEATNSAQIWCLHSSLRQHSQESAVNRYIQIRFALAYLHGELLKRLVLNGMQSVVLLKASNKTIVNFQ